MSYRGQWFKDLPNTVLIYPSEGHCCDKHHFKRLGFPLVVSKCNTVHSLQGLTIGESHQFKYLLCLLEKKSEARWPNSHYVMLSRVEDADHCGCQDIVTMAELNEIGAHDGWKLCHEEKNKLKELGASTRQRLQEDEKGTKEEFLSLMKWYLVYCRRNLSTHATLDDTNKVAVEDKLNEWEAQLERITSAF